LGGTGEQVVAFCRRSSSRKPAHGGCGQRGPRRVALAVRGHEAPEAAKAVPVSGVLGLAERRRHRGQTDSIGGAAARAGGGRFWNGSDSERGEKTETAARGRAATKVDLQDKPVRRLDRQD